MKKIGLIGLAIVAVVIILSGLSYNDNVPELTKVTESSEWSKSPIEPPTWSNAERKMTPTPLEPKGTPTPLEPKGTSTPEIDELQRTEMCVVKVKQPPVRQTVEPVRPIGVPETYEWNEKTQRWENIYGVAFK